MRKLKHMKKWHQIVLAAAFWILVWQLLAFAMPNKILFASPLDTVKALFSMAVTSTFWKSVGTSFLHITGGFAMALAAGTLLAALSYFIKIADVLITPLMKLIKAVPVASFTILLLIWLPSRGLPMAVSFIMVLPVIYINVLKGLESADDKLLEMAQVFRMSFGRKLKNIYLPATVPHLVAACSVGLGFCWKSGIAAEVIALSADSIGRQIYDAKLYLMTPELFAWTAAIVIISVCFERIVMLLIKKLTSYRVK